MPVLALPPVKGFQSVDWALRRDVVSLDAMGGTMQRTERNGYKWAATLQSPPAQGDEAAVLQGWLAQVSRGDRWFYLSPPQACLRGNWSPGERVSDGKFIDGSASEWDAESSEISVNARRLKVKNTGVANGKALLDKLTTGPKLTLIRASTAKYWDRYGIMRTAAINAPRFDYSPSTIGAFKGLLIEEARTNLLLRSQEFDNATWVNSQTTDVANTVTAPDGTLTADTLIESTANADHNISQTITKAASAITYTGTLFVKSFGRSYVYLNFGDASSNGASSVFNLATGAVVSTSTFGTGFVAGAASITPCRDGWFRVTFTFTTNTATSLITAIYTSNGIGTSTYAGDGVSGLYLWGAQLEAGDFASSYIPTTTASATRSVETCTIATSSVPGFNEVALSMFLEAYATADPTAGARYIDLGLDVNNRHTFLSTTSATVFRATTLTASATQVSQNPVTPTPGVTLLRGAYGVALNSANFTVNGVSAGDDTGVTMPTGLTTICFGHSLASTGQLNGHLRKFALYATRLANADLLTLSNGGAITTPAIATWDFSLTQIGPAGFQCEAGQPHVLMADLYEGVASDWGVRISNSAEVIERESTFTEPGRVVVPFTPSEDAGNLRLYCNTAIANDSVYFGNVSIARCLTVNGGAQLGTKLAVDGGPVAMAAALKVGEFVTVRAGGTWQLLQLVEDFDTDSTGAGTLRFEPALRGYPADGEPVIIRDAFARFALSGNAAIDSVRAPNFHGFAIDAIEDPTVIADEIQDDLIWAWDVETLTLAPGIGSGTPAITRAGTATRTNASGYVEAVAADVARFDYDPVTLAIKGLLIEEARTNVVLWDNDCTNAAWTKTNVTAAKDQIGPDNVASSASSLLATSANGTCLQAITLGSSARYQTAYVKRLIGTGTINMTMDNGSTWTVITLTAAWTRVDIPTQTIANPTVGFRIVTSGDKIAVAYVQNENGAFATSAIATTTASVARAADIDMLLTSQLPGFAEGSISYVAEILVPSFSATAIVTQISDNSYNNRTLVGVSATNAVGNAIVGGSTTLNPTGAPARVATVTRLAFATAANDANLAMNGTLSVADTSGAMPTAQTRLNIGADHTGANACNGHVRKLRIYKRRLPDQMVKALSA